MSIKSKAFCHCCKEKSRNSNGMRSIACENIKGLMLCDACNFKLIDQHYLYLDDKIILKVTGQLGDFKIIEAFSYVKPEKVDYWERRKRLDELNQMSGFPPDNGVHASY